jgi:hypothetical protein
LVTSFGFPSIGISLGHLHTGDFPDWNPFIREIIGSVVEGSRLEIHISTSSGKNRTYKPTLTKIEPNHELRWYGKGLLPGLLNGERIFTIE